MSLVQVPPGETDCNRLLHNGWPGASETDVGDGKDSEEHALAAHMRQNLPPLRHLRLGARQVNPPTRNPRPPCLTLQQQWQLAKACAMNPKHIKMEYVCSQCFGRSLTGRSSCRFCLAGMSNAMTVTLGQWPPIGAPRAMLAQYDATGQEQSMRDPLPPELNGQGSAEVDMTDAPQPSPNQERPLQQLGLQQLRQQITRLERHILELPQEGYGHLRDSLEDSLAATRAELMARKPEGQALDQAIAKHKQATKAKQIAEQNLEQAKESLRLATTAYEQTKLAEEAAAQEVQKQRSAISDFEPTQPPATMLPAPTMVGLYQILHQAGLGDDHLRAVASLLGTQLPPRPPAPATAQATAPMAPSATHLAQEGQDLRHPANLASQLLASGPAAPTGPALQARQGRSPLPRRKLPQRSGEADYASTFRDASQPARSTSRTPDRDHGLSPGASPRHTGALSPTLPMGPPVPILSQVILWIWVGGSLDGDLMFLMFAHFLPPNASPHWQAAHKLSRKLFFQILWPSLFRFAHVRERRARNKKRPTSWRQTGEVPTRGIDLAPLGSSSLSAGARPLRRIHPLRGVRVGEAKQPGPSSSQSQPPSSQRHHPCNHLSVSPALPYIRPGSSYAWLTEKMKPSPADGSLALIHGDGAWAQHRHAPSTKVAGVLPTYSENGFDAMRWRCYRRASMRFRRPLPSTLMPAQALQAPLHPQ